MWRGKEEKESVSLRAITHSASSRAADGGRGPSKVSIYCHRITEDPFEAHRTFCIHPLPPQHAKKSTPPKPQETPTSTMRVSNCDPDACRQHPAIVVAEESGRAYLPADGFAGRDQGAKREHLVQSRLRHTELTKKLNLASPPLYRCCIHLEVPLRSNTSVLFLDKSLYISLGELEGRRAGETALCRSALSLRFDASSGRRPSKDNKRAQMDAGYRGARGATLGRGEGIAREAAPGSPLSPHRAHRVRKRGDSDTRGHSGTRGLLPFRSNTNADGRNAREAAFPLRSHSSHRQRTSNRGPVNFKTWTKPAGSDEAEERQEHLCRLNTDPLEGTPENLSLKEALELLRPDFISRSRGRVRRLARRCRRRRYLQESDPDLAVQGLGEGRGKPNRNCTTPDPLSDNLFKPSERTISGKEMQLRSRRIYNQLPEVTQKKEEEKKRAVSQANRLRADVYKKVKLGQIFGDKAPLKILK
ncbi:uncharacterized protein AB9W97_019096 isoform 1-T3 [Spinachia spinachia]